MKIINLNQDEKKIELLINSNENKNAFIDFKITEMVKREYNINITIISDEDIIYNGYKDEIGNKLYNYIIYFKLEEN